MNRTTKTLIGVGIGVLAVGAMVAASAQPQQRGRQAANNDAKAEIGVKAPLFTLTDLDGNKHALEEVLAAEDTNAVVLEWFNPKCPVVKGHYGHGTMNETQREFDGEGVVWLRINSGGEGKQGADPKDNQDAAEDWKMEGPILLDASGEVGKSYGAKTTPHMYVIDADGVLRYMGDIDDARGGRSEATVNYVEAALKSVLAGETVETTKTRSYGCGVKYAN